MSAAAAAPEASQGQKGFLGAIERIGNKIPHPAMIFLGLIVIVILLSQVLYMVWWLLVSLTVIPLVWAF